MVFFLTDSLLAKWAQIPQNLVESFPRKVEAGIVIGAFSFILMPWFCDGMSSKMSNILVSNGKVNGKVDINIQMFATCDYQN